MNGRTLHYDFWANGEALESLRASSAPEKSRTLMAHIIATLYLWHGRIRGVDHGVAVWPDWSLQQMEERLDAAQSLWAEIVGALESEGSREVSYTNSKGESFTSTVSEIFTHLMFHGAYHRGQLATVLREAGLQPAYTDFIHATRTKLI